MVAAEAEVSVCQQGAAMPVEAGYFAKGSITTHNHLFSHNRVPEVQDAVAPSLSQVRPSESISADLSSSQADQDVERTGKVPDSSLGSSILQNAPFIHSGSFADVGLRKFMEDEHVRIDDLSSHLGSVLKLPKPSAFYGVFDGHGGHEAATYMRNNVIRIFFEDVNFPQTWDSDDGFVNEVENSIHRAFLLADQALADDGTVNSSAGTTALTALVLGRLLMVANAGDCRAVLCRKGEAIDMSHDHRPSYPAERRRVEELGGFIDDGYLNGVLSVTRALGDWDMKFPNGSASPLIAEPELRKVVLTDDDEFLIIGCDGIWDVLSSQQAVNIVHRGLRRFHNPEQCARDLVKEALRLNTFDNLTVIVVCFSNQEHQDSQEPPSPPPQKLRCCSLSAEALCSLKSWLEGGSGH